MKSEFSLHTVSKGEAATILLKHHYLKDISKGFKSGFNYGLYRGGDFVGVIIFTGFPVPELVKGMFGLERDNQRGLYELSRLCLIPDVQKEEHNIASFFIAKAIKKLRAETTVRCILSYADEGFHSGVVYKASNFGYYGLTAKKKDFWILEDKVYIKHSRGKIKGLAGEWRDRNRKHRYVMIYDKKLRKQMRWVAQ